MNYETANITSTNVFMYDTLEMIGQFNGWANTSACLEHRYFR